MPTVGRTLAGFLCEEQALNYFAAECEESEASTEGLKALWSEAKHRLGEPAANTGNPTIEELPTEADEYVHTFLSAPSWSPIFAENPHWELKLIEIEPLLAYQFSIIDRAMDAHSADFSVPPTVNE